MKLCVLLFVAFVEIAAGENMEEFCKTPPKMINPLKCCPMPLSSLNEENWTRCLKEAGVTVPDSGSLVDVDPMDMVGKCVGDCLLEADGLLMGKEIQLDKVKEMLIEKTKDDTVWGEVVRTVVENTTMAIERVSMDQNPFKCETKGDLFLHIFTANLLFNCPESEWTNGVDECDDMKKRFDNCQLPDMEHPM